MALSEARKRDAPGGQKIPLPLVVEMKCLRKTNVCTCERYYADFIKLCTHSALMALCD